MNAAEAEWMVEIALARAQEMRAENKRLRAENERLRDLLVQANEAFDEVTGDYAKGLVDGEPWRQYATVELALSGSPVGDDR